MNALVIGVRRTGKSTLGYYLAHQLSRAIIIWDPNNNFRAFEATTTPKELENFFRHLAETQDHEIPFSSLQSPKQQTVDRFTVCYLPHPNHLESEFETFSEIVRRRMSGVYSLMLDESDEAIQNRQRMSDALAWWMRRAPTDADYPETVHIIQMTHSPQDVYTRARNLLTDVFAFRTEGSPELDWLEDYTQNPQVRDIVKNLPFRHVFHTWMNPMGQREFEVWTDPSKWYIDIGSNRGGKYRNKTFERTETDGTTEIEKRPE